MNEQERHDIRAIYLAIKSPPQRSAIEDLLVVDGFEVSSFAGPTGLWSRFQDRPARLIIADRNFPNNWSGLDLASRIRAEFLVPYVYIVLLSTMGQVQDISEALAAGVDDYVVKPHNKFQIRSRVLVAFRWLNYIDSLNAGVATTHNRISTVNSESDGNGVQLNR